MKDFCKANKEMFRKILATVVAVVCLSCVCNAEVTAITEEKLNNGDFKQGVGYRYRTYGEATITKSVKLNNGTVVAINGDLTIKGSVSLDGDAELIIQGKLIMAAGSSLTVTGNASVAVLECITGKGTLNLIANGNTRRESMISVLGGVDNSSVNVSITIGDTKFDSENQGSSAQNLFYIPGLTYYQKKGGEINLNNKEGDAYKYAYYEVFGGKKDYEDLLPIELTYFVANQSKDNVEFAWQTASEKDNDYFTIEYSFNAVDFEELAIVAGAGTTTEEQNYQYTDFYAKHNGTVYYRLKQTDYDGEYSYSNTVAVKFGGKQDYDSQVNLAVYPNPSADYIVIGGGEYRSVKFVSATGAVLGVEGSKAMHSVGNLPSGVNFVVIETADGEVVKTIVKK